MLMASAPPPLTAKYPPQDLPLPKVLPSRQGTRSLPDLLKQVMPAPTPSPEVFPQEVLLLPSDSAYQPETRFLPEDWRSPEDPISPEMSASGQPHPAHALPSKAPDSLTPPPLLKAADSTLTAASWLPIGGSNFTGNVGIGTTSPGARFAVKGPGLFNSTTTIEGGGLNIDGGIMASDRRIQFHRKCRHRDNLTRRTLCRQRPRTL